MKRRNSTQLESTKVKTRQIIHLTDEPVESSDVTADGITLLSSEVAKFSAQFCDESEFCDDCEICSEAPSREEFVECFTTIHPTSFSRIYAARADKYDLIQFVVAAGRADLFDVMAKAQGPEWLEEAVGHFFWSFDAKYANQVATFIAEVQHSFSYEFYMANLHMPSLLKVKTKCPKALEELLQRYLDGKIRLTPKQTRALMGGVYNVIPTGEERAVHCGKLKAALAVMDLKNSASAVKSMLSATIMAFDADEKLMDAANYVLRGVATTYPGFPEFMNRLKARFCK